MDGTKQSTHADADRRDEDRQGYAEIEGILSELLREHERLLTLTRAHRDAMVGADSNAMRACLNQQNEVVQRIARLEDRRARAAQRLCPPQAHGGRVTVTAIAEQAPGPIRQRLLDLAGRLRELLDSLRKENGALRIAAESLASHMQGLMQQVSRRLSGAGTYARGSAQSAAPVAGAIDLTT